MNTKLMIEEVVDEYRNRAYAAIGKENLNSLNEMIVERDCTWVRNALIKHEAAVLERVKDNVKYKSLNALANEGYRFAIAGKDLEEALSTADHLRGSVVLFTYMRDLNWFTARIGTTILRGSTEIKVTPTNYKTLFDIQSDCYQFSDIEAPAGVCIACEG